MSSEQQGVCLPRQQGHPFTANEGSVRSPLRKLRACMSACPPTLLLLRQQAVYGHSLQLGAPSLRLHQVRVAWQFYKQTPEILVSQRDCLISTSEQGWMCNPDRHALRSKYLQEPLRKGREPPELLFCQIWGCPICRNTTAKSGMSQIWLTISSKLIDYGTQ